MGNVNSTFLSEEELKDFKKSTIFSYAEIENLYERFCYLDKLHQGYLTYNELNNIPEFEMNPFSKLICIAIEKRLDYINITFAHFLDFLSIFHEKTPKECRIKFLFSVLDLNKDERLCRSVLKRINNIMGNNNNKEVEDILSTYDFDRKGYLDYNDFVFFYNEDDSIESKMIIDFTKTIKHSVKLKLSDIVLPYFLKRKR
ncbi:ca2+-binding protein (ef-hand superfamily) [Vairimorpha apis BRL 01]|uniref:Calcineurin subunit B n=1 Tax=Vairimorpha apis BRL 01 TaxID=1037528 RepID=T0L8Q1_9MICR|nr:ca2+-binding protein (ef-hand superfamily) [Vairimorpha apis BRL 01]